jgi:hypothetical protein
MMPCPKKLSRVTIRRGSPSNQMKLSNIIVFIKEYPERIILGVCSLILLFVLTGHLTGGRENKMISDLEQQKANLEYVLKANSPAAPEPIDYLKKLKDVWEGIQQPIEGKGWLMYRPPIVTVKFETEIIISAVKTTNLPPLAKNPQSSREPDKITLNWESNISSTARIKSYRVYRRAAGEKDFAVIAEAPVANSDGNSFAYTDNGCNPETEYAYYFTAVSDDNTAVKQESDPSAEVKIATVKDYDIKFSLVDLERNRVYTKVDKYLDGKWESFQWFVIKGDKIDKDRFITGCTLTDFQEDIFESVMSGGVVIKKKTFRVFYLDKKGREYSFLIPQK